MSYLRTRRGQILLASFLLSSLLLGANPGVDIQVSRFFFDGDFFLKRAWWQQPLRDGLVYFIGLSLVSVLGIFVFNAWTGRTVLGINGRKVCYLLAVLAIGAGLIVNVALKDNFGRARPWDVQEFAGQRSFTPVFVVSDACDNNCSFPSGEGAGAFFSLALALALSRKRAVLAAAAAFGCLVSFSRIAAGAHFFSDTVVSFFVMLILADVLYYYMLVPQGVRVPAASAPKEAPARVESA